MKGASPSRANASPGVQADSNAGATSPLSDGRQGHAGGSAFARFLLVRLGQALPVALVVVCINFFLIHAAPGDPVFALIGQTETTPEYIQQIRRDFGLDRPLLVQLTTYIGKVASLDLGYSLRYRQPVLDLILERLPATLLLMGTALVFSSVVGVLLGVLAARRPHGLVDNATTFLALVGYSMPVFWLGQLLLLTFALNLPLFPVQGMASIRAPSEGIGRILNIMHHLVLPVLTFSIYHLALIFRLTRIKMIDVLSQDYITTARAKGLSPARITFRHALLNALLPIVTVIGYNFGFMLAGSVLVETVFGWPGLGRLMFEAVTARDYPTLLGLFLFISFFVVIVNIATDVIYALIDPRILYRSM